MNSKLRLRRLVFGFFFALIAVFGLVGNVMSLTEAAYAVDETNSNEQNTNEENNNQEQNNENTNDEKNEENKEENKEEENKEEEKTTNKNQCKESLGAVGWLVCPTTGVIAKAVDWLYDKIEDILIINPVSMSDSSPIYVIWKYFLGMTNIVFVIFLLVVIYSQLTGLGISNYGIKKTLPKLIVAAVLVNLSFLICSIATDVSNLMGNSLRGVFDSVEEAALANVNMDDGAVKTMRVSTADMFSKMASGASIATVAGVAAFEVGAVWMLIPTVVGALVAVVIGLVTIALRQAVVTLLVMISPLAIVAYMLPNTDKLFDKWKKLMTTMLVFYPMFSLLYGASSLAGFALIMSAKDGFTILLGTAIQIFPLIFSWKLMKMSGTFLGTINSKLHGLTTKPMGRLERWADSHRRLTKHRNLTMDRPATPSLRLMQFMNKQSHDRLLQTGEYLEFEKRRGMGYHISKKYNGDGTPNQEGVDAYNRQARDMEYRQIVDRHMNNMNMGLGQLEVVKLYGSPQLKAQLSELDGRNLRAADTLKFEAARGANIEYENAKSFHMRNVDTMNAKSDNDAILAGDTRHAMHRLATGGAEGASQQERMNYHLGRYAEMKNIMEGNDKRTEDILAESADTFDAQANLRQKKYGSYYRLSVPTQDVVNKIDKLVKDHGAGDHIDQIIGGWRTVAARGDTDLLGEHIEAFIDGENLELGTYAAQATANFCMMDMKGEPIMRRLGKFVNMQTAAIFNDMDPEARRTKRYISMSEYVNGEYVDRDENGNIKYDADGNPEMKRVRKDMVKLLPGTSYKDIERTTMQYQADFVRRYSYDLVEEALTGNRVFDYERFKKNDMGMWDSIMPSVISDHFSYLTGSEASLSMRKAVTGVDVSEHGFDWEGIFGKDKNTGVVAPGITPQQKLDYINEVLKKRTDDFLGGQVSTQIARTKSDMLKAIKTRFVLESALEEALGCSMKDALEGKSELFAKINDKDYISQVFDKNSAMDSEERWHAKLLTKILGLTDEKISDAEYAELERSNAGEVRERWRNSYKKSALVGFSKMTHKGYQGETKDALIKILDPEEIYEREVAAKEKAKREANSSGESHERVEVEENEFEHEDYEEEGMPVDFDESSYGGASGGDRSDLAKDIKDIFDTYNRGDRSGDVSGFWGEAKGKIVGSSADGSRETDAIIDEIENSISGYTNVGSLYRDLRDRFKLD